MACSSCGTGGGCSTSGSSSGCGKSGGCSSGGCNRLNSFDWLGNMEMDNSRQFNVVEVKFKGGRKEYFRNPHNIELYTGDAVIIDVPNGHHLGHVSLQGELVRLQMKKKQIAQDDTIRLIYRKASQKDLDKYIQAKNREETTLFRTRQLARDLKLEMKLSDVEFQADNTKATFYYSADERVDFRELIKLLAGEFKIRVEMKQISLRQEASRLGGIGSCGRELCCSTWLTDFKNVNTSAARYQNLALNPTKLSGQCGRLKCCLNYELDTYMDALKGIPEIDRPLNTTRGEAVLQKTDIFKKIMWFAYRDDITTWLPISVQRVNEILELNKSGEKPATLESDSELDKQESIEQKKDKEELARFDDKFKKKKRKKKSKPKPGTTTSTQGEARPQNTAPKPSPNTSKQNNNNKQGPKPQNPQGPKQPNNNNKQTQQQGPKPNNTNKKPGNQEQKPNQSSQKGNNTPKQNQGDNPKGPRPNNGSQRPFKNNRNNKNE
jgi:cell fate regulator YaaT (PSP1 superfamily)